MGRHMPEATFVFQFTGDHGFIVRHRHPLSLKLNEKLLNLIFLEHQKDKKEQLIFSEIDGLKIASYSSPLYPGWLTGSILSFDEDFDLIRAELAGSGRLILALISVDPESFSLEDILESGSILKDLAEEQELAEVFLTPSSALLLVKSTRIFKNQRPQIELILSGSKLVHKNSDFFY